MKKLFSILMSIMLVVTLVPSMAFAEGAQSGQLYCMLAGDTAYSEGVKINANEVDGLTSAFEFKQNVQQNLYFAVSDGEGGYVAVPVSKAVVTDPVNITQHVHPQNGTLDFYQITVTTPGTYKLVSTYGGTAYEMTVTCGENTNMGTQNPRPMYWANPTNTAAPSDVADDGHDELVFPGVTSSNLDGWYDRLETDAGAGTFYLGWMIDGKMMTIVRNGFLVSSNPDIVTVNAGTGEASDRYVLEFKSAGECTISTKDGNFVLDVVVTGPSGGNEPPLGNFFASYKLPSESDMGYINNGKFESDSETNVSFYVYARNFNDENPPIVKYISDDEAIIITAELLRDDQTMPVVWDLSGIEYYTYKMTVNPVQHESEGVLLAVGGDGPPAHEMFFEISSEISSGTEPSYFGDDGVNFENSEGIVFKDNQGISLFDANFRLPGNPRNCGEDLFIVNTSVNPGDNYFYVELAGEDDLPENPASILADVYVRYDGRYNVNNGVDLGWINEPGKKSMFTVERVGETRTYKVSAAKYDGNEDLFLIFAYNGALNSIYIRHGIDITYGAGVDNIGFSFFNNSYYLGGAVTKDTRIINKGTENEKAVFNDLGNLDDGSGELGSFIVLDVDLKPGHYISSIVNAKDYNSLLPYYFDLRAYYDVYKNGSKLDPMNSGTGIHAGNIAEEGVGAAYQLLHHIAKYVNPADTAMVSRLSNVIVGDENVTNFVSSIAALKANNPSDKYRAELIGGAQQLYVFIPTNKACEIKINTAPLVTTSNAVGIGGGSVAAFGFTPKAETTHADYNNMLKQYYKEDVEVEKVYELSGGLSDTADVMFKLPDNANPADYEVVWFKGDTPVPVPIRHAEGYVVMSTGHFSDYALIKKTEEQTEPELPIEPSDPGEYIYQNEIKMLPGGGAGYGKQGFIRYRDENGNNIQCTITGVENKNPGIAAASINGNNFEIRAHQLGMATVELTFEYTKNNETIVRTKELTIDVVKELWTCDIVPQSENNMFPGGELSFRANVQHNYYNSNTNRIEENVNSSYNLAWSVSTEGSHGVTVTPDSSNKNCVIVKSTDASPQGNYNLTCSVYPVVNGVTQTDAACSAGYGFGVTNSYYSLDVSGFDADLDVGETMTVTTTVTHHQKGQSSTAIDAEIQSDFPPNRGVLKLVSTIKDSVTKVTTFIFERLSERDSQLRFFSEFNDNGMRYVYKDFRMNWLNYVQPYFVFEGLNTKLDGDVLTNWNGSSSARRDPWATAYTFEGYIGYREDGQNGYFKVIPGNKIKVMDASGNAVAGAVTYDEGNPYLVTISLPSTGTYTVMPEAEGVKFSKSAQITVGGEAKQVVFSSKPLLNGDELLYTPAETKKFINSTLQFNIAGKESTATTSSYVYVAKYLDGNFVGLEQVQGELEGEYIDANWNHVSPAASGMTIQRTNGALFSFTVDKSYFNGFTTGQRRYDVRVKNDGETFNSTVQIININDTPSKAGPYRILSEMLIDLAEYTGHSRPTNRMQVNGHGSALQFNNKLTYWDSCFYVYNENTSSDVHFNPETDENEIRYYIGDADDFVLQAKLKDSEGEWKAIDEIPANYRAFTLEYVGYKKEYSPVYRVELKTDINDAALTQGGNRVTDLYDFRLLYMGDSKFLAQKSDGSYEFTTAKDPRQIRLVYNDDFAEFGIEQYFYDESGNCWATGNELKFFKTGASTATQIMIRPDVLASVANKVVFGEKDYVLINSPEELKNIKIYATEKDNGQPKYTELTEDTSPFVVTHETSDLSTYYKITYMYPDKDIYGPHYTLKYAGTYNDKINDKYGMTGEHTVFNSTDLVTGKVTVRVDKVDGVIDAVPEDDSTVVGTEVILGPNALGDDQDEIEVDAGQVSITLGGTVLIGNVKNQNGTVHLKLWNVKDDENYLNGGSDKMKEEVQKCEKAFDFKFDADDLDIEFGEDGYATIRIPFEDGEAYVYYISDRGEKEYVKCEYDSENKCIIFTTNHFSTYGISFEKPENIGEGDDSGNDDNTGSNEGSGSQSGTTGGFIPSTPSTPKDPVTNQSGTTTTVPSTNADVSQSTTMKGGETTTTVTQTTADKIVESAVANKSEEVVIDATYKTDTASQSTKAAEVALPTETLAQIAEKTEADVTIKTDVAEIKLDNQTLAAVAEQAEGQSVSIVAEKVKPADKEEKDTVYIELKIVCSEGKTISDFKGGGVSVTVEAPKGKKDVVCVYIDEQGHMHKVPGQLNADGTYTFTTGHFSTYAIMGADEAEAAIKAQKEAVKAIKFKLSSKIVKTKAGKKAVKLTWKTGTDLKFDGFAVYRSAKKNTGYGKKPIFTTEKTTYTNTAVKAGKKYYYKVRGFVTIDGEKVFTDYSTKAWRTIK